MLFFIDDKTAISLHDENEKCCEWATYFDQTCMWIWIVTLFFRVNQTFFWYLCAELSLVFVWGRIFFQLNGQDNNHDE